MSVVFNCSCGQCTVYIVHCTLYSVHYTLYSVYCTVYTVHCTIQCGKVPELTFSPIGPIDSYFSFSLVLNLLLGLNTI